MQRGVLSITQAAKCTQEDTQRHLASLQLLVAGCRGDGSQVHALHVLAFYSIVRIIEYSLSKRHGGSTSTQRPSVDKSLAAGRAGPIHYWPHSVDT